MSFTECHDDAILGSLIEIVCGMKNLYLPVLLTLIHTFATAATPVPDENCIDIPDSRDSCSPLLACFGNSGEYFAGRALGRDEGTLAGVTNFGAISTGTWVSRNFIGTGEANFECDNGHWGKVIFHYRDGVSGTVKGFGFTNHGVSIRAWSGHYIQDFLDGQSGQVDNKLMCGEVEIPLR
jgi:hypothetical protein